MKTLALVVAAVFSAAASTASGRVVAYTLDRSAIAAAAIDQAIEGPFSDAPSLKALPIALESPGAANHTVKTVSIYCQAYKIENPVSVLMQQLVPQPDTTRKIDVTLRMIRGSTLLRCFGAGELKAICKNEVKLTAEVRFNAPDGSAVVQPITASVEREGRVGGFCGNIARYTEIVSREAGIALIAKAQNIYEQRSVAP